MKTHNAWTRANGERPASMRRVRDSLDVRVYGRTHSPKPKPGPCQIVECRCGEKTTARSPSAQNLAGWTVGEWPERPQEYGKVAGTCRKCNKAKAAQVAAGEAEVAA